MFRCGQQWGPRLAAPVSGEGKYRGRQNVVSQRRETDTDLHSALTWFILRNVEQLGQKELRVIWQWIILWLGEAAGQSCGERGVVGRGEREAELCADVLHVCHSLHGGRGREGPTVGVQSGLEDVDGVPWH